MTFLENIFSKATDFVKKVLGVKHILYDIMVVKKLQNTSNFSKLLSRELNS